MVARGLPAIPTGHRGDRRGSASIRIISNCWQDDEFEWDGLLDISPHPILPRPVQDPHPPLYLACTKVDTVKLAAELGIGTLVLGFAGADEIRVMKETYDRWGVASFCLTYTENAQFTSAVGESCWYPRLMATLVVHKAPTFEDAARAAEAIAAADPHIARVVVFGSVAKRTQKPGSDIDMIVVSGSLGSQSDGHGATKYALRQAAEAACGIKCEVILTTIGEWEWSLEHARSSVFGEGHAHGITLFERPCPPSAPSAEETAVLRDDWALALQDLEEAHRKNLELVRILKSIPGEAAAGEWHPADRSYTYESALESAHMSIEKCLTALGRLHLRRYLDNTHNIDIMAGKLRPTPSGPFVDAVLDTLDTAEDDGSHTNWRLAPYLGQSDSFQQMTTPENTAAHIRAAANLLEHALAAIAKSALRPTPIPTDDATILNRCAEPIDYLRHHADPDYLRTGALPPPTPQAAPA